MKQYDFQKVFFEPWIGKHYQNEKTKILIVAHNYPCNEPYAVCSNCGNRMEHPNCITVGSIAWINEYIHGSGLSWNRRTFDNFLRSYLNRRNFEKSDVDNFWDSVAFYNYVQKANSTRIGVMRNEDYINSLDAFKEVLELLMPTHIITWGNVYHRIPIRRIEKTMQIDGKVYNYCEIKDMLSFGFPIMLKIHHPSMFYSWYRWGMVISEFLKIHL